MPGSSARKLPGVDWLAFGIGVLALTFSYFYPLLLTLVAFAIFAPSILRELGLLRDTDEWTRQIMHRAGFHTAMMACALIFLNHLASSNNWYEPISAISSDQPFAGEGIYKPVIGVFLLSYLIQYWGARQGVFRILLGAAATSLAPLLYFLIGRQGDRWLFAGTSLAVFVLLLLLALLVRRWPRVAGATLLGLGAAISFLTLRSIDNPDLAWVLMQSVLQILLLFGVTGAALLLESRSQGGD